MLGRKSYTQEELDQARTAIDQQVAAYKKLVKAIDGTADPTVRSALDAFEPLFFNNMTVVLDRYFVHRLRAVAGKDGNPLNEVRALSASIMSNDGRLTSDRPITSLEFSQLSKAFFDELERRFT